jgi:23S rRNA C2498 (ribose-2'-O)-methylase RlmM
MNTPNQFMGFYLLTRNGFEAEVASECNELSASNDLPGYVQTKPNTGYAVPLTAINVCQMVSVYITGFLPVKLYRC